LKKVIASFADDWEEKRFLAEHKKCKEGNYQGRAEKALHESPNRGLTPKKPKTQGLIASGDDIIAPPKKWSVHEGEKKESFRGQNHWRNELKKSE